MSMPATSREACTKRGLIAICLVDGRRRFLPIMSPEPSNWKGGMPAERYLELRFSHSTVSPLGLDSKGSASREPPRAS